MDDVIPSQEVVLMHILQTIHNVCIETGQQQLALIAVHDLTSFLYSSM